MSTKDTEQSSNNPLDFLQNVTLGQQDLFENITAIVLKVYKALIDEEVIRKAGTKYSHHTPKYDRWGNNPGSIQIGEEKVRINVPRLLNKEDGKTESPEVYKEMRTMTAPEERVMKKIALGLSQKDYEQVTRNLEKSFGLSQSSVSRKFKQKSREVLEDFYNRDLGCHDFLALVVDGKYLKREQVLIALGITITGYKIPLGFVHAGSENSMAVKGLFKDLINRNFRFDKGILVLTDGSTGMIKAIKETFGNLAFRQRCQWHKRENVVSLLKDSQKDIFRRKIQNGYNEEDYFEAREALMNVLRELENLNYSAANSLREGMEETLTLHKLGLKKALGTTLTTTNTIENINSLMEKHTRKIKRWKNGEMLARWVAVSLSLIEPKLIRIPNYQKLKLLRIAMTEQLIKKIKKAS